MATNDLTIEDCCLTAEDLFRLPPETQVLWDWFMDRGAVATGINILTTKTNSAGDYFWPGLGFIDWPSLSQPVCHCGEQKNEDSDWFCLSCSGKLKAGFNALEQLRNLYPPHEEDMTDFFPESEKDNDG